MKWRRAFSPTPTVNAVSSCMRIMKCSDGIWPLVELNWGPFFAIFELLLLFWLFSWLYFLQLSWKKKNNCLLAPSGVNRTKYADGLLLACVQTSRSSPVSWFLRFCLIDAYGTKTEKWLTCGVNSWGLPYKVDGSDRRKFKKEPLKVARNPFFECGGSLIFTPRGVNSFGKAVPVSTFFRITQLYQTMNLNPPPLPPQSYADHPSLLY